ncbi:MAG TPA: dolichyl-phosphate beta-glucosyltransferase [Blastocatellia bacterium]|nr:dolichyl-phosphate beta-glucosyltransferase [Blastocatellia bacterium]
MGLALSIIIPAYNEEQRIGPSLDDVLRFLRSAPYRAEVIVIDDGSKDKTAQAVMDRVASYRESGHELRVLTNTPNRGKGYSVRRGVSEARGDIILFTDADLSAPITEAPLLIDPIISGRADVTFGSRALDRNLIGVHQPFMRDFGGRVFNLFMRAITGLKFKDTQCGFKAFRRESARRVFELQRIERFGFDPEVLYIAKKQSNRLLEVPVQWNHCEGGELQNKLNYMRDSINMFADLIRIRANDIAGRYDHSSQELEAAESSANRPEPGKEIRER